MKPGGGWEGSELPYTGLPVGGGWWSLGSRPGWGWVSPSMGVRGLASCRWSVNSSVSLPQRPLGSGQG